MGKSILIYLLGFVVVAAVISLNNSNVLNQGNETSVSHFAKSQARNIARSKVNMIISKMSDTKTFGASYYRVNDTTEHDYLGGNVNYSVYDTTVKYKGFDFDYVKLKVKAEFSEETKEIVVMLNPDENLLHEPMDYSLCSGDLLSLNGKGILVESAIDKNSNANIHSNKDIVINGEGIGTHGFASYVSSLSLSGSGSYISPPDNPDSDPVSEKVSSISIPNVNFPYIESIADEKYSSDLTLTGTITLGTKESPKIIYCSKKIYLGPAVVKGYGSVVANEDIEMKGSVIPESPAYYGKFGIYTGGKFITNVDSKIIHANVYSKKESELNGNDITLIGSVVSKSLIKINDDSIKVFYKPIKASVNGQIMGEPPPSHKRFKAYSWFE